MGRFMAIGRGGGSSRPGTWPLLAGALVAMLLAGCGGSGGPARPAVCKLKAQQAIAQGLGVRLGGVGYAKSSGNNGMPQCAFKTRTANRAVVITVNVDSGPQAYFRLLRTVAEAGQIFGRPPPDFHPPQGLSGLGPYASWFPNNDQLMATNYKDLLTVTVTWPGAGRNEEVKIARSAVKPYLVRPRGRVNAHDYP